MYPPREINLYTMSLLVMKAVADILLIFFPQRIIEHYWWTWFWSVYSQVIVVKIVVLSVYRVSRKLCLQMSLLWFISTWFKREGFKNISNLRYISAWLHVQVTDYPSCPDITAPDLSAIIQNCYHVLKWIFHRLAMKQPNIPKTNVLFLTSTTIHVSPLDLSPLPGSFQAAWSE